MKYEHCRAQKQTCASTGKRRKISLTPLRTMETRAAKKARLDSLLVDVTPEIPNLSTSLNARSSSLLSPPNSNLSPSNSSPADISSLNEETKFPCSFSPPQTTFLFKPISVAQSPQGPPETHLLSRTHVGQNHNGTWFINSSPASFNPTLSETYFRTPLKPRAQVIYGDELSDDDSSTPQEFPNRCLKKKIDDDDLSFHEKTSSPELMEPSEVALHKKLISKRKRTSAAPTKSKNFKLPLYHENVQDGKPEPIGQPKVWAFKRQQLCETLPYYNAYQSGAYTQDGIARSILIDKEVSIRDKFDDEVVITSVGGGRLLDEETGRMVYKTDQTFSSVANGFMRAMDLKSPVAVIAGQGNKISPSKLPHYYNVLDWFHVTDVWQEKVTGHKNIRVSVWKVRLEKINLSERSWWAAQTSPLRHVTTPTVTAIHSCAICRQESKVRFSLGPACLNVTCPGYFDFGIEYDDCDLDYHAAFLGERTQYLGDLPEPLVPRPITDQDLTRDSAYGYEKLCKRGIVCQKCGCCTRRIEWRQWSCENNDCDYTYRVKQFLVPLNEAIATNLQPLDIVDNEKRESTIKNPHASIPFSQSIVGSYDLYNYDLPNESGGVSGSIRHFKSSKLINIQRDGPNDLFQQIQGSELALKRGIAVHKGTTQETLTNHFTQNFVSSKSQYGPDCINVVQGAAYKYLVAQESKGFDEAPPSIIKAAKRMIWAGQHALQNSHEPYQPFNECLVLGYFDGSKIGYHDDGEKTLGPTVATLSLGANAIMNFRPKKKTHIPALEGNTRSRGRGSRLATDGRVRREATNKSEHPAILSLKLEHGDIVIMHGREIQKLFEHEVIPQGGLRFALTCRHIDPKTLANDEERRIAAEKGAFPSGSEQYDYNGSIHATSVMIQEDRAANISNHIKAKFQIGELELSDMQVILQSLTEYVSKASKLA